MASFSCDSSSPNNWSDSYSSSHSHLIHLVSLLPSNIHIPSETINTAVISNILSFTFLRCWCSRRSSSHQIFEHFECFVIRVPISVRVHVALRSILQPFERFIINDRLSLSRAQRFHKEISFSEEDEKKDDDADSNVKIKKKTLNKFEKEFALKTGFKKPRCCGYTTFCGILYHCSHSSSISMFKK